MSAWLFIAATVIFTLLGTLVLAEWLSRRFADYARERRLCGADRISPACGPQCGRGLCDPFAAPHRPGEEE